ncbi:ATP-dependent DNA helicase RecG [Hoyosella subflava]|uniref:ATP-dependent DNA helicase RecG n=1 Tax=Hoyosella subflava (strain DSM 45089 / JCM 17490 / NBRC 109087 / DQS3-9A1) TaxID=443218 RepID=F6EMQ0_HOYSD|nr:ATP-dependent DNA helicase RecG [Hoyosella subflava]AEF41608.1 ATP-dependent DNA helicase RecG [Hoyosella subflava DQS3-9A1]
MEAAVSLTDRLDGLLGRGVSAKLENEFGITSVAHLLQHYPRRYARGGMPLGEDEAQAGDHITVVATIARVDEIRMKPPKKGSFLKVTLHADTQQLEATFFNPKVLRHVMKPGKKMMFSGTVGFFRKNMQLTHPSYLELRETADAESVRGSGQLAELARAAQKADSDIESDLLRDIIPIYPSTKNIQSWEIWSCVRIVLDQLAPLPEMLPEGVVTQNQLLSYDQAIRLIHLPDSEADFRNAQDRLRFDEALLMQLILAQQRVTESRRSAPPMTAKAEGIAARFDTNLPFTLTGGQRAAGETIAERIAQPAPMNVLLQGEVGSGKTIVALRAMLQAIDAGYQCALLAPTEVLATQHYRSLRSMLGALGQGGELGADDYATGVVLLTGSMTVSQRKTALLKIVTGDAGLVIGTHALIQDTVEFFNLGLVVIDEQHRFGVEQRDHLRGKAQAGKTPHMLVMTATPIPRTIAMTVFGALEVITLRELPRGRSPISTKVLALSASRKWLPRVWERIVEEAAQGRQAYVVCSRIGDDESGSAGNGSEAPSTTAVVDMFGYLRSGPLAELRVGLLHGRLPADEKDRVMRDFSAGEIDVLVCTTVIEVGVDVPNATVMAIVDADRFGVSQLHQLRGRVGRGAHAGLCILMSEAAEGSSALHRLSAVAATTDGFRLAELDLQQRREGDVLGSAQSGTRSSLKLLSLLDHGAVIEKARDIADAMVTDDPELARAPQLAAMVNAIGDGAGIDYLDMT